MGAKAALKGYRLQALYTIFRILNSENSHTLTFQPEGNEDLAIFAQTGELLETIQVKAYSENLTISTLTKFFHRVVKLYVYVDVSPRDEDWTELLRELAQYRNLYLLVTAREEDWKRASISRADLSIEELGFPGLNENPDYDLFLA